MVLSPLENKVVLIKANTELLFYLYIKCTIITLFSISKAYFNPEFIIVVVVVIVAVATIGAKFCSRSNI